MPEKIVHIIAADHEGRKSCIGLESTMGGGDVAAVLTAIASGQLCLSEPTRGLQDAAGIVGQGDCSVVGVSLTPSPLGFPDPLAPGGYHPSDNFGPCFEPSMAPASLVLDYVSGRLTLVESGHARGAELSVNGARELIRTSSTMCWYYEHGWAQPLYRGSLRIIHSLDTQAGSSDDSGHGFAHQAAATGVELTSLAEGPDMIYTAISWLRTLLDAERSDPAALTAGILNACETLHPVVRPWSGETAAYRPGSVVGGSDCPLLVINVPSGEMRLYSTEADNDGEYLCGTELDSEGTAEMRSILFAELSKLGTYPESRFVETDFDDYYYAPARLDPYGSALAPWSKRLQPSAPLPHTHGKSFHAQPPRGAGRFATDGASFDGDPF